MRHLTKIAALGAATTVLAIAGMGAANATVTHNSDGTVSVGKGDVQSALGYGSGNDAQLQADWKAGKITFGGSTAKAERLIVDYRMSCWGSDDIAHRIFYVPGTVTSTVGTPTPKGTADKVTGWTLAVTPGNDSTFVADPGFRSDQVPMREVIPAGCNVNEIIGNDGYYPDLNGPVTSTGTGGLTVSGNGRTNVPLG